MYLVDVTNSYARLVQSQLDTTDVTYVKVYSLGSTNIVYTESPRTIGIVLENHQHNIHHSEIVFLINQLFKHSDVNYTLTTDPDQHLIELHIKK